MDKILINIILNDETKEFVKQQPKAVAKKIWYNIKRIAGGEKNSDLFKKLEGEIWEFRTLFNGLCYRLFAFWDTTENALVVTTHGVVKKTEKTPRKEIEKAARIRKEYINNKK